MTPDLTNITLDPSVDMAIPGALASETDDIFSRNSISTVGKMFLAGVTAWLLNRPARLKIRGTQEQITLLKAALLASRKFQDELYRSGATVQSIMNKLQAKNLATTEFENKLGIPWPL